MMSAAIRVFVRAAALQIEEAALKAGPSSLAKGKARAVSSTAQHPAPPPRSSQSTSDGRETHENPGSEASRVMPDHVRTPRTIMPSAARAQRGSTLTPAETGEGSSKGYGSDLPDLEDPAQSDANHVSAIPRSSLGKLTTTPDATSSTTNNDIAGGSDDGSHHSSSTSRTSPTPGTSEPTKRLPFHTPVSAVDPIAPDTVSRTSEADTAQDDEDNPVVMRASRIPSSRIGRLFHYGSLAASLSLGAASESFRRSTGSDPGKGSVFMSDANVRRLVASLGKMRGAALKLGQFMSIQDNNMLPPEIEKVLQQVQAHANYMPEWQMEKVMSIELGSNWSSLFSSFDRTPIASASIGQVHRAVLASTNSPVAIKIQFPGIASSISSDLANLSVLLRSSALLPKGLYLQNTIAVMRRELEDECDYIREAEAGRRFSNLLKGDEFFVVPKIVEEATTGKVLTTEWMDGKPLSRMKNMSQETRDKIGTNVLRLCLQELFQFRFMQTDPNWANFLYDASNDKLQLIDFGASREYSKGFMDGWYRLLTAALEGQREVMKVESERLGYLTGEENEEMLKAHLDSTAIVASPFSHQGPYPFANQTITDSVRALIPVMLKHRLTPPPNETYSLNRKLSGAFLMCARLKANVDCRRLWEEEVGSYQTDTV